MNKENTDLGVISALLERLEKQRLPRLLALKEKLGDGSLLTDLDVQFLDEAMSDASRLKPLLDKNPQYQSLATSLISLYKDITRKALENERSRSKNKKTI